MALSALWVASGSPCAGLRVPRCGCRAVRASFVPVSASLRYVPGASSPGEAAPRGGGGDGSGGSLPPVPRISRPPLKLWGLVGSNSRGADSRHIVAGVNLCCVEGRFSLRVVLVPDRAVVSGRGRAGRH